MKRVRGGNVNVSKSILKVEKSTQRKFAEIQQIEALFLIELMLLASLQKIAKLCFLTDNSRGEYESLGLCTSRELGEWLCDGS